MTQTEIDRDRRDHSVRLSYSDKSKYHPDNVKNGSLIFLPSPPYSLCWLVPNGEKVDKGSPIANVFTELYFDDHAHTTPPVGASEGWTLSGMWTNERGLYTTITAPCAGVLQKYKGDDSKSYPRVSTAEWIGRIIEEGSNAEDNGVRLYVLYDSSYLMSDKAEDDELTCDLLDPIHVLANEIKKEINGLLKSEEKGKAASRARLKCAKIISSCTYIDVNLNEAPTYQVIDPLLGPDSDTDKRILSWAFNAIKEPKTAVFVATKDGGLLAEICRSFRERQTPVFCSNLNNQCNEWLNSLIEFIVHSYWIKTKYNVERTKVSLLSWGQLLKDQEEQRKQEDREKREEREEQRRNAADRRMRE